MYSMLRELLLKYLLLKVPTKTKNSPTKPLVPGRPNVAKTKTIKRKEYLGNICTIIH